MTNPRRHRRLLTSLLTLLPILLASCLAHLPPQPNPNPQPVEITIGGGHLLVTVNATRGLAVVKLIDGEKVTADRNPVTGEVDPLAQTYGWVCDYTPRLKPELQAGLGTLGAMTGATVANEPGGAASVTQTFERGTAKATYKVQGEDLTITVAITNNGTLPLKCHGWGAVPPTGNWGPYWFQTQIAYFGNFHGIDTLTTNGWDNVTPSFWHRLRCAAVWFKDGGGRDWALGVSTKGIGPYRCMVNPGFVLTDRPVPSNETLVYEVKFRCSRNTDRNYLLANYYADHVAEFGPLQYDVDQRPWTIFQRFGGGHVSPDNPLGFHTAEWRTDTPSGCNQLDADLGPKMTVANCQGLLRWGPVPPKKGEWGYAVDFSDLDPGQKLCLPILSQKFAARGLKNGHIARPGFLLRYAQAGTAHSARESVTYSPVLDTPTTRQEIAARFRACADLGIRGFYVDDLIDIDVTRVLAAARPEMGRGVLTFTEFGNDVSAVSGAFYGELEGANGSYAISYLGDQWNVLRKLYPQLPIVVRNRSDMETEAFVTYCANNKLTALVDDMGFGIDPRYKGIGDTPGLPAHMAAAYAGRMVQTATGWEWVP